MDSMKTLEKNNDHVQKLLSFYSIFVVNANNKHSDIAIFFVCQLLEHENIEK